MKQFLLVFSLVFFSFTSFAQQYWPWGFAFPTCSTMAPPTTNCTKWPIVIEGDWDDASTWNNNTIPGNNDIVCIPAGKTVNFSGILDYSTLRMQIFVCGTFDFNFNPAGKFSLAAWSFIQIYKDGKILSRPGDAELIEIGGEDVWRRNNATINGPYVLSFPYVGAGVLPVAFDYFKVEQKQPYTVRLEWATLIENNSSSFIIERSADQKGWTEIGSIASQGNTNSRKVYSHLDMQPVNGYNYYRLKQVDIDGQTTHSQIVRFNNQVRKNLIVFPNPVENVAQLYGKESFKAGQTIQVIDAKGTRIKIITPTGGNRLQIDLSGYASGLYLIQLIENGKVVENLQVVKQ